MAKLVDKERLAKLAKALDDRAKAAVAAEKARAEAAEQALGERIAANEAFVAAQPGVDEAQNNRIKALEDDAPVKQAAIEAAQAAADQAQDEVDAVEERATALEGRMDAVEEDVARLDGAEDVEGSVKKQIKDAIDQVNGAAAGLEERVKANEDDIAEMKAEEAKIREDFAAADAQALADAKDYADQQITALVNGAPDAMNTLNELAKAINDNQGVYDAYVAEHAQAMAQQKADLQAEIDADVKVVADELDKQKDAAQEGTLAYQIAQEKVRAEGQEAAIRQELANEKAALQAEIDADVKVEADRAVEEEGKIREEFAAADEALHATVKAEMAAVIQSLVAEITEEGMLRIALGGLEGDEVLVIKEQEIPFATDEDIDAIIAGLDAPAE